jgi:hypothetical protein
VTKQWQIGCSAFRGRRLAVALWLAVTLVSGRAVAAADLDGVSMPPTWQAGGKALRLNGVGMRTYSVFHIHIYVAGLYLEQPTSSAEEILHSDAAKLLVIRFVHEVNAEQARKAWVEGFEDNCRAPCHLRGPDLLRFLAAVPSFHRGDESTLLFSAHGVDITLNGQSLGTVTDAQFSRAMLATFIGSYPPSEPFKHGLLGLSP